MGLSGSNAEVSYGDIFRQAEVEFSTFNFEQADVVWLMETFDRNEAEGLKLIEQGLVLPAYDYCLKCSHVFNLLDARKAISVAERTRYIARIRNIARKVAKKYVLQREEMGHPLLQRSEKVG